MTCRRQLGVVSLAAGLALVGCAGTNLTAAAPTGVPTTWAQPSAQPPPTARPSRRSADLPPDALLSVEGGDAVAGDIGSFTWRNAGSDSPGLPGEPITVGLGETLSLLLEPRVAINNWTAAMERFPSATSLTSPLGQGHGDHVSFPTPPRGTWSVQVSVWFAANQGQASYYWRVEVK